VTISWKRGVGKKAASRTAGYSCIKAKALFHG
jgi:hypothetical protein